MNSKLLVISALTALLSGPASSHASDSALEEAMRQGAQRLTADEIAETLVGKTVTYRLPDQREVKVHYGDDNLASARMVGGDWSDSGFYGITDGNRICISWSRSDAGRLRCFDVLAVGDSIRKFKPDGSHAMDAVAFENGNSL